MYMKARHIYVAVIALVMSLPAFCQYGGAPSYSPKVIKATPILTSYPSPSVNAKSALYAKEVYLKPSPYKFGYDVKDEYGNSQFRHEDGDEHGNKKGSYGYTDAYGIYRQVEYIADSHGFQALVKTNEPGTANKNPASVQLMAADSPIVVKPHLVAKPGIPAYKATGPGHTSGYLPAASGFLPALKHVNLKNYEKLPKMAHHVGYYPH